jgi:hypothetical protein
VVSADTFSMEFRIRIIVPGFVSVFLTSGGLSIGHLFLFSDFLASTEAHIPQGDPGRQSSFVSLPERGVRTLILHLEKC